MGELVQGRSSPILTPSDVGPLVALAVVALVSVEMKIKEWRGDEQSKHFLVFFGTKQNERQMIRRRKEGGKEGGMIQGRMESENDALI